MALEDIKITEDLIYDDGVNSEIFRKWYPATNMLDVWWFTYCENKLFSTQTEFNLLREFYIKVRKDVIKSELETHQAVQRCVHLTAFGVGLLAFCAGFGICWLVFVR